MPNTEENGERQLAERVLGGDRRSLARAITRIENHPTAAEELIAAFEGQTGKAHRLGITGPPGAGKSTVVDKIIAAFRAENKRVGVIAVDPTSPFSGGAILGDRIRMVRHTEDEGVFIRSMASRGSLGGLSRATIDVADAFDASGFEEIVLETVGVGQTELDIANAADTTVVVLIPESGDGIQAMKAGLMEIADIFVINKCDLPGADRLERELQVMLEMRTRGERQVPVLQTNARDGHGIEPVMHAVKEHREYLMSTGKIQERRRKNLASRVWNIAEDILRRTIHEHELLSKELDVLLDKVYRHNHTPYRAAREILSWHAKHFLGEAANE